MLERVNFALQIAGLLAVLAASISCAAFIVGRKRSLGYQWNSFEGFLLVIQVLVVAVFVITVLAGSPLSVISDGDRGSESWNFE